MVLDSRVKSEKNNVVLKLRDKDKSQISYTKLNYKWAKEANKNGKCSN